MELKNQFLLVLKLLFTQVAINRKVLLFCFVLLAESHTERVFNPLSHLYYQIL